MATGVDNGFTRGWPAWARAAWAIGLIASCLGGLIAALVGLGIISNRTLASVGSSTDQAPTVPVFLSVYVGGLIAIVGAAIALEHLYGIKGERTILVLGGAFFLLGAWGRPWWIYASVRRMGWFAAIDSDAAMRTILTVLGGLLAAAGIFARM